MFYQFRLVVYFLITLATVLSLTSSCTLRKREKPPAGEDATKAKVTVEIATPTAPQGEENATPKDPLLSAKKNSLSNQWTGMLFKEELGYTDSGDDSLISLLQKRTENLSSPLAQQIRKLRMIESADQNKVILRIDLEESPDSIIRLHLEGQKKGDGPYAELNIQEGIQEGTQEGSQWSGEFRCLDLNQGPRCATSLFKIIHKNSPSSISFAEAIIRSTSTTVHTTAHTTIPSESIFNSLQAEMESFTVVYGRSEFQIRLTTTQGDSLYFNGPLVAPVHPSPMEISLNTTPDLLDPANAAWAPSVRPEISKYASSATLLENDGRGVLKIRIPSFILTFSRSKLAIISP